MMSLFRLSPKQIQNILHTQLPHHGPTLNSRLSKRPLLLLQIQDALLDTVGDGELVDDDVDSLIEAVHAIDGLFFDKLIQGERTENL